jgi:hypothetical protein
MDLLPTVPHAMGELRRVADPALWRILWLDFDRESHAEVALPCVLDSHPVLRLQHAKPHSLAVQRDRAIHGHEKRLEVTANP